MALTKITPQMFDTSATAHDLNVDNGTFVVDASANRVGIGTASPSFKFHSSETGGSTIAGLFQTNQTDSYISFQASGTTDNSTVRIGAVGDDLRAYVNGAFRFAITSAGNVGIGTTTPSTTLEVRRDVAASADLDAPSVKLYNNSDGGSAIEFTNAVAGKSKISFGVEGTGQFTDETFLGFSTGANGGLSERMRITSAGLVGIGTTSPQSYYSKNLVVLTDGDGTGGLTLLSPATDDNAYLCFADGTSGAATYAGYLGYDHNNDKAFIGVGGATQMTILSNGRTAIGGNHTPAHALHVKGPVSSTGGVSAVFDGTDSTNTYIQIKNSNSGYSWQIGATNAGVRFYNDQTSSHALGISATGAVEAGSGSASLPSLSFLNDTNTGIYNGAPDNLYFSLGGVRKGFWSATQFNVTGNGVFSGTGSFGGNLSVTGQGDFSTVVYVGNQNSEFAENNLRFRSGGHAYIDHNTTGQNINFRVGNSSALDTDALTLSSTGLCYFPYFLGIRTSTRGDGGTPAYSLTMSADYSGNAIEIFRTNNSKMLQYMSADGKYYFDMNGSSTPEIRFRNNGTDWMRTQGTHLFVGGSAPQTKGAGTTASGTGSNQTVLQVQGAVDMGYQGRYTHGLWGPTTITSSARYTHLRTAMWGGGSPHGNSEYIMGGFIITGYRYSTTANHRSIHQFHNWSGSLYNYTVSQLIDGGGWNTASHVYVDSTGYVTIRLESQSAAYRMFYVEYIQYSIYNKIATEITAVTVSNSATI